MTTPITATPLPADLPARTDLPPLVQKVFGEPRFHTDGDVAAVTFAANGTVRAVDEAGVLRHWTEDGQLLHRFYLSDLETLWCFGPGGDILASGNDDLLLWDAQDGQLIKRVELHAWVTALAFSPDGMTLASGHDDGSVRFWDLLTHRLVGQIEAHPQPISALSFDPTGKNFATAGEDRVVKIWDADAHRLVSELHSHTDRVPALAWSPDGTLLISAGWDTSARVWKVDQTDPLILLNSHAEQVQGLTYSPSGAFLATFDSDNDIHLWSEPTTGKVARVLRGHADEIRCMAFSPDGRKLASAGADRVVHIWSTETGAQLAGPNPKAKHALAVIPEENRLLLASTGGPQFRLWDTETGQDVLPSNDGPAYSVAVSPDGRWLAVGGTDYFTRLYDRRNPAQGPKQLEATKPPIGSLAISANSRWAVHTSPADGLVWLWNLETADPHLILIEAADGCTLEGLALHPDGQRIAVGGIDYLSTGERDGAVCVWDANSKEKVATFEQGVYALAIDSTGKYLAGAGVADKVYVWDLETYEQVFELEGHQERIHCVAFSPDGSFLASGGDDMTIRVWDVLSGRLIANRVFDTPIQGLVFSPDGSLIFTGNGNTTCYQIEVQKLLEE